MAKFIMEQLLSKELRYEFDERVAIILADHPTQLARAREVAWAQVVDRHNPVLSDKTIEQSLS